MMTASEEIHAPLEQPVPTMTARQRVTIGLPKSHHPSERRFPLTPEGVTILSDRGYEVKMEHGAAESIRYTDARYERCGATLTGRTEALACDIVVSISPLDAADIRGLRRGALLLTLLRPEHQTPQAIAELLRRHVIAIALDLVTDIDGNTPFADILSEIDGRAAMTVAASMLTDAESGKGILLGGVAGIVPCEVTVLGSGIAACAAARAASGAGATVRIFDNNVYSLRRAARQLGPWAITSAMHPNVVGHALQSADVVIVTDMNDRTEPIGADRAAVMKSGVLVFDISAHPGRIFPSLPAVDCCDVNAALREMVAGRRICYVNAGGVVPRTAAMAMTNCLTTMLADFACCDGAANALKLLPGLQRAAYTFLGKAVNPHIAGIAGVRAVDISIFLNLS